MFVSNDFVCRIFDWPAWRSIGVIAIVIGLSACEKHAEHQTPAPEVGVIALAKDAMPLDYRYSARTQGEREIEVRARIGGIIQKRLYREGEYVAENTSLFKIDPAPYEAQVRSTQGRLDVARAQLAAAKPQRDRMLQLFGRSIVTARDRDTAEEAFEMARASVASAQADLERARLDLSYTDVRAPISGFTGRAEHSEGSLVRPDDDSSLLTTMAQSRRLYVNFTMPASEARSLREALAQNADAVRLQLHAAGMEGDKVTARIEFIDTRVQADTGTVSVRAIVDNAGDVLAPGQFVQARLMGLSSAPAIFIPERAVMHGSEGPFVWKLDKDNRASMQAVQVGTGFRNFISIDSGLAEGDRIVVDGILKVAPGSAVKAVPVKLLAREP